MRTFKVEVNFIALICSDVAFVLDLCSRHGGGPDCPAVESHHITAAAGGLESDECVCGPVYNSAQHTADLEAASESH